jgi:hypothetical protein
MLYGSHLHGREEDECPLDIAINLMLEIISKRFKLQLVLLHTFKADGSGEHLSISHNCFCS